MSAARTFMSMGSAYLSICREVMKNGVVVAPRGDETRELLSYNFRLMNPYGAITRKGYSKPMAAVEALQLIGGFSDPSLVLQVNPTMARFMSDEGGQAIYQHGNYGERVGPFLDSVVTKLKDDPDTRQAVINIYSAHRDYVDEPDIPCTLALQFMIRDFALDLHVTMRSNDIWWGLPYDMFQFTQLQMSVANVLNIPYGSYYHTANSMHAYERNFNDINDMISESQLSDLGFVPRGLNASTIQDLHTLAISIAKGDIFLNATPAEAWYTTRVRYVSPRA